MPIPRRHEIDLPLPGIAPTAPAKKARLLTYAQARACENAPDVGRSRCRCGGTFRGRKRFGADPSVADFANLPRTDPHRIAAPAAVQTPLFEEIEQDRRTAAARRGSRKGAAGTASSPSAVGEGRG